jgi:hypothetical protein
VLYFYEKQEAVLQCEVRNTAVPDTFAIVLTETDGGVRTHYVHGSNDAHRLWLAIEQQLRATGWSGPVGHAYVFRKSRASLPAARGPACAAPPPNARR